MYENETETERRIRRQRSGATAGAVLTAFAGIGVAFIVFSMTSRRGDHSLDIVNAGVYLLLGLAVIWANAAGRARSYSLAFRLGVFSVVTAIVMGFADAILVLTSTKDWIVASPAAGPYAFLFLVYTGFASCVTMTVK